MVTVGKRPLANLCAVVVAPSSNDWVEQPYNQRGFGLLVGVQDALNLPQHSQFAVLCGLNEQLSFIFADMEAKEVEPVIDVSDMSLF